MLKDVGMEGLEKFAFFILCLTLSLVTWPCPQTKGLKSWVGNYRKLFQQILPGLKFFPLTLVQYRIFLPSQNLHFPPRVSLSWLWNLYFISPLLPQILPFELDLYVSHLGVVIWSWLSSCFLWWVFYALTLWVWPLTVDKIQNNPPVQLIRKTQTLPLFLTVGTSIPLLMAPSWEFETKQMILEICVR